MCECVTSNGETCPGRSSVRACGVGLLGVSGRLPQGPVGSLEGRSPRQAVCGLRSPPVSITRCFGWSGSNWHSFASRSCLIAHLWKSAASGRRGGAPVWELTSIHYYKVWVVYLSLVRSLWQVTSARSRPPLSTFETHVSASSSRPGMCLYTSRP